MWYEERGVARGGRGLSSLFLHRAREFKRTGETTPSSDTMQTATTPTDETTPTSSTHASASPTCRVQVRLPSGHVLRRVFPSSASLNDVIAFIVSSDASYSSSTLTLIQVWCLNHIELHDPIHFDSLAISSS